MRAGQRRAEPTRLLQLGRAPRGPDLVGAVLQGYLRCLGSPNLEVGSRLCVDAVPNNAPCQLTIDLSPQYWGFVCQIVKGGWNFLGSGSTGSGGVIGAGGPCALDFTNSKIHVSPNPALPDPDPNASLVTDIYLDLSATMASTTPPVNIYATLIDRAGRGSSTPVLVTQWQ